MDQKSVLSIQNLTKRIGKKTIIDQISFEVPKGEVFGFLGPNGAGKTTTIRMLVGLISITEGDVFINGVNLKKNFEKALSHVGAIVENPELYKFLSGYHNLLHRARMVSGISRQRIDEVVQLVGLSNRIRDKVKTYSLGMRQRLGIAQALLHKPRILILDEPTNGLDPAGIREMRDYLRKLTREEGISVMVSSHLLSEMELMCDRVAIIQNGKLLQVQSLHQNECNKNGRFNIFFEVDDAAQSQKLIEKYIDDTSVTIIEKGIQMNIQKPQIAEINFLLAKAEIKVYGIRIISQTLEDQFLEATRGEGIV